MLAAAPNALHTTFSSAYRQCLEEILGRGAFAAPRDLPTREVLHCSFALSDPRARTLNVRQYSTSYCIAEALWYLLGRNDAQWIERYAAFWRKIAKPDGSCTSAYGFKVLPQLNRVVEELRESPSSRRAVVNILLPTDHDNPLDVPCTIALQYLVRDGRLHAQTYMRSCDVVWGLPYDVFSFTVFQELVAGLLGLPLGNYVHTATSLHLYERHGARASNALDDVLGARPFPSPMSPLTWPAPLADLEHEEERMRSSLRPIVGRWSREIPRPWSDWRLILAARQARLLHDAEAEAACWSLLTDHGLAEANRA